jgi:aspartyl protease family protein
MILFANRKPRYQAPASLSNKLPAFCFSQLAKRARGLFCQLSAMALLGAYSAVSHGMDIDVLGLFKNSAMLKIDGKEVLMRVGQTSEGGVFLVSADSKQAVVLIGDQEYLLSLSSRIGAEFTKPVSQTVSVLLNNAGQYKTSGSINGRSVSFLVDTGANIVALNTPMADSLGIDYSSSRLMQATTASGVVESREVILSSVQIGGIKVNNVKAAVLKGDFPRDILLGMSFLRNVEMNENRGVLQLTGKY